MIVYLDCYLTHADNQRLLALSGEGWSISETKPLWRARDLESCFVVAFDSPDVFTEELGREIVAHALITLNEGNRLRTVSAFCGLLT